jgi:tetratricopeptide (TPR) repeat protein
MRKLILTFLLACACTIAFPQKPAELFEQASGYYYDGEYDSALLIYKKIYKKGKGDESLIAKSHYNMADIYFEKADYKKAKGIFLEILATDYDEMDKGGIGEGIMGEPYALYKNNSCKILAEIALKEKDYSKALEYTGLFDKVYPYRHFCGNEYAANDIYVAYTYARCYEGLGDTSQAIAVLLPECFFNAYANNEIAVKLATRLIKEKYSAEELQEQLKKAVMSIHSRIEGNGKNKIGVYYVSIFDTYVRLQSESIRLYDKKEADALKNLTESNRQKYYFMHDDFYKSLTK